MQLWNRHILAVQLRNGIAKIDRFSDAILTEISTESRAQNSDEPDETGPAVVLVLEAKDYAVRASYALVSFFEPAA